MIIVSLVCMIFLFHFRSALVAILTLPVAILMMFIAMYYIHLNSNIMSLSGHRHRHRSHGGWRHRDDRECAQASGKMGSRGQARETATTSSLTPPRKSAKPLFFSLLIIAVSFIPVFSLQAQEGRLFKPLAYTKTFSMLFASILSVTLVPVLMLLFIRGKIAPEHKNPINRFLIWAYKPFVHLGPEFPKTIAAFGPGRTGDHHSCLSGISDRSSCRRLYEGSLLYMPTGLPGQSITETVHVTQLEDKIIKQFPEVVSVFGKGGRARTSTDPAPLEMGEATIVLKARGAMAQRHDPGEI